MVNLLLKFMVFSNEFGVIDTDWGIGTLRDKLKYQHLETPASPYLWVNIATAVLQYHAFSAQSELLLDLMRSWNHLAARMYITKHLAGPSKCGETKKNAMTSF